MAKTVFQVSPDGGTTKYDIRDTNIAPVELSSTASQAYAKGKQFTLDSDGLLYEATGAISQGDTFVIYPTTNYNCKLSDSITDQIKSINDGVESAYQLVEDTVGWSGKNLLPIKLSEIKSLNIDGTWSGNVYTIRGVNFTFYANADGYITKIVGNGTASSNITNLFLSQNLSFKASAYIGNGNPQSISGDNGLRITNSSFSINFFFRQGNTLTFNADTDSLRLDIRIASGTTLNNEEFYPMLRRADIIDSTYEPYHASVEETKCDNSVIGTVENGTNPTKEYAVGEHMIRNGKFCTVTVPVTTSSTWTLGGNYVEGTIADNMIKQSTFSGTTDGNGVLNVYNGLDRKILCALSDTGQRVFTPFANITDSKMAIRGVYTTGSAIASASVSGTYYYI